MIPLTFLHDEHIDRPKLSEQKKPIWVYSSSTPQVGSEQLVGLWIEIAQKMYISSHELNIWECTSPR